MISHVISKYSCTLCNNSYIGQTTRHLRHRISEHRGVSHLTGNAMKSFSHSSVREHLSRCPRSTCLPEHFTVLSTGSTDLELLIKERLLINRCVPNLNANAGSFELCSHESALSGQSRGQWTEQWSTLLSSLVSQLLLFDYIVITGLLSF